MAKTNNAPEATTNQPTNPTPPATEDKGAKPRKPMFRLSRNIAGHMAGETFTPEQAEAFCKTHELKGEVYFIQVE